MRAKIVAEKKQYSLYSSTFMPKKKDFQIEGQIPPGLIFEMTGTEAELKERELAILKRGEHTWLVEVKAGT